MNEWRNKEAVNTGHDIRTDGMVSNLLATASHPVQYVAHCLSLWTPLEAPGWLVTAIDTDIKPTVTLNTAFCCSRIQALVQQWDKYLNVNEDYVDVWCVPLVLHVTYTQLVGTKFLTAEGLPPCCFTLLVQVFHTCKFARCKATIAAR